MGRTISKKHNKIAKVQDNILTLVENLHGELDAAYDARELLEADFQEMKNHLYEQKAVRTELEARIKLLGAQSALVDHLREELSIVEEQRDSAKRRLDHTNSILDQTRQERDQLSQKCESQAAHYDELMKKKVELESKLVRLEVQVAESDRLRTELAETRHGSQLLDKKNKDLNSQLEALEISKNAMELDVLTSHEAFNNLANENNELKEQLAEAKDEQMELQATIDKQQADQIILLDASRRVQRESKVILSRYNSLKRELELGKKALGEICTTRTNTTNNPRKRRRKKA